MVISHNSVAALRRCLESLEASDGRDRLEVIVVDNGSRDGSAALDSDFPNVQFVRLPKNFGLTKALNIGWRAANAEYVLFLHADTEVEPPAVAALANVLDARPDTWAVCPLLVDGQGAPAPQLGRFPPDQTFRPAQVTGSEPLAVEYPRGAALMVRVAVIKSIRQIDERYGQFGSDADLAAQIVRAGKSILLVPAARVRHDGGGEHSPAELADVRLARAVFAGKYHGFAAGLQARLASILQPLVSFRFGELKYTLAGQKIDGSQY